MKPGSTQEPSAGTTVRAGRHDELRPADRRDPAVLG
jgi:hypothetical protein